MTLRPTSAVVLILAASVSSLLACRREEGGERPPVASAEPLRAPSSGNVESDDVASRTRRTAGGVAPVIWLGLDGLDWEILDRLAAEGKMPNWKRLVADAYSGRIASFMPILSPIIWTTIATGVGPDAHRILDFQEVDGKTGQKVPISGFSRAVPAVWNLASAAGRKVGVVGWWATHPAEEVNGFFVSDRASPILYEKLPLSGAAFPVSLSAGVEQVVARDGRVGEAELATFVNLPPREIARALASGQGMENAVVALSRILAATRVYQRTARDLYDRQLPDLMMLYLEGTDEIAHVFAPYIPPKLSCVSDEDFRRYSGVVAAYYAVIDRMLGQWMRRVEEDQATLIVHSDHGFKWGADRPCERSSLNWSTAAYWHRLDGVFAAWGNRVAPGHAARTATMFDPAPTVLALLGVPSDRRMTGRPLTAAFRKLGALVRKDQFASIAVRRVPSVPISREQSSEYAKKLLALGYLSGSEAKPLPATGSDRPGMTEGAWNNLGLYERETLKNLSAAREAFEKSLELRPDYHSPMFNLAILFRAQGDDARARDWLFKSLAAGHADPEGTLLGWASWYEENGRAAAASPLLEQAIRQYQSEPLARAVAISRYRRKDCPGGFAILSEFEEKTTDPNTLNYLALLKTCLGRRQEAVALLQRSLALKPDQPGAIQSLNFLRGGARAPAPH